MNKPYCLIVPRYSGIVFRTSAESHATQKGKSRCWRFSLLCLLLLVCLSPCIGHGENALFEESDFQLQLLSCQSESGNVILTLSMENTAETERVFSVISPEVDGAFAWTANLEIGETIPVPAMENKQAEIILQGDQPFNEPENISFFILLDNGISTRAAIRLSDGSIDPAEPASDTPAVFPHPVRQDDISPVLLRDKRPDVAAEPDYVDVRVCLREGDALRLLSTLSSEARDGETVAEFSNLVMALNPDDPFLITCTEEKTDNGTEWSTDKLGLYSDSVYFANMTVTIQGDELSFQLEADEFGTVSTAPWDLFDAGTAIAFLYTSTESDTDPVSAGSTSLSLTMDGPLQFALLPVGELGDIVCLFEYYYPDGTYIVHTMDL